jgi:hypothetical protein
VSQDNPEADRSVEERVLLRFADPGTAATVEGHRGYLEVSRDMKRDSATAEMPWRACSCFSAQGVGCGAGVPDRVRLQPCPT